MRFYTNVQMVGDHFLVRGYENGRQNYYTSYQPFRALNR